MPTAPLQRGKINECPVYDTKPSDSEVLFVECLFIAITPRSILTWSGSTC